MKAGPGLDGRGNVSFGGGMGIGAEMWRGEGTREDIALLGREGGNRDRGG